MKLGPALKEKISKLLPRLASNHEGERLATIAAIERLLKSAGCDWHDFTAGFGQVEVREKTSERSGPPAPAGKREMAGADLLQLCDLILNGKGDPLSARSAEFLESLQDRALRFAVVYLSEKQLSWLMSLSKRAGLD